jgi:hypothetical protein
LTLSKYQSNWRQEDWPADFCKGNKPTFRAQPKSKFGSIVTKGNKAGDAYFSMNQGHPGLETRGTAPGRVGLVKPMFDDEL